MFIKPIEIAQNKLKIKRSTQPILLQRRDKKKGIMYWWIVYSDDEDDMKEMVLGYKRGD